MRPSKILLVLGLTGTLLAQSPNQNLLMTAGRLGGFDKGDSLYRAVFIIGIPQNYPQKVFLRVFDADLGGKFDTFAPVGQTRYRLFGQGGLLGPVFSQNDSLPGSKPLMDITLGDDRYYDNRWRTLASLSKEQGELRGGQYQFRLIVDGQEDAGLNIYQVVVSAQEKENEEVPGLKIYSPALSIRISEKKDLATQIRFTIPATAQTLRIVNFDADDVRSPNTIKFTTNQRPAVVLPLSQDGRSAISEINLLNSEKGQEGAIVVEGNTEPNNIQFWIYDDKGQLVQLTYPSLIAPINSLPEPKIALTPLSDCNSVMLDANSSTDANGDELSFCWIFPDGKTATGSRIVHDFGQPGKFDVLLEVSDNSGFVANTSRLTQNVVINHRPVAKVSCPDKGCPGENISFDGSGSTDADGSIIRYLWDFGDGKKDVGQKPSHSFTRPGTYTISLTVEDDSKAVCNSHKVTRKIWINDAPVPKLNLLKNLVAISETVQVNATGSIDSDGDIVRYFWDFGDGSTAEGLSVTHPYTQPGKYTIRLEVYDDARLTNSMVWESKVVTVNAPPVPAFDFRKVVAAEEKIEFDGAASTDPDGYITQFIWDLGDGTVKKGGRITHAYAQPGTYTVKLQVIDNTSVANNNTAITGSIRVNNPPIADAGGNRLVNSSVVEFDGRQSSDTDDAIINYFWDFGDGQTGQGAQLTHVYVFPGRYRVTLFVTDKSGTLSARQSNTVEVVVNNPPIADAGREQNVAVNEKVKFNGGFSRDPDGKIMTYKWELANGVFLEGKTVEYQFKKPGVYQVALTVTDNDGAEDIHYVTVFVNSAPVPLIAPIPRIAPGQSLTCDGTASFDTDGKIDYAEWDFGDGTPTATGLKVKHIYMQPGRYILKLTVRDNTATTNNTISTTHPIAVNYAPEPNAGKDILTCEQSVSFDASKSTDADKDVLSYFWDFGDGRTGSGQKVVHTYAVPGIYPVTLCVDDNQNLANSIRQTIIKVHVNSAPQAFIEGNRDTLCAGEPLMLNAAKSFDNEKGLLRYLWEFGDGTGAEGINQIHTYKKGGGYIVRLKVSDDSNLPCNTSIAEKLVYVIDAPIADAGADQEVCANTVVQFDASRSVGGGRLIKSYEWDFGDGEKGGGVNPTHAYAKPGSYNVRLTITVPDIGDCENSSEDIMVVRVISAPFAEYTVTSEGCVGAELIFDAASSFAENANISEYSWEFGDATTGKGRLVKHKFSKPGRYLTVLKVRTDSNKGCNTAQAENLVVINDPPQAVIEVYAANETPTIPETYSTRTGTLLNFNGARSLDRDGRLRRYTWNFGDGGKATGISAQYQFKKSGTFWTTLTVEDNSKTGCNFHTDSLKINVQDIPLVAVNAPAVAFVNEAVDFKTSAEKIAALSDANTSWIFSDGETLSGVNVKKTFKSSGKYQAQVTSNNHLSMAHQITIYEMPVIRIPESISLDLGDNLIINPVISNPFNTPFKLQWLTGDGATSEQTNLTYKYPKAGDYQLTLNIFYREIGYGQPKAIQIPVKINPVPQIVIETRPEKIFAGGARDEVFFIANTSGFIGLLNYHWDFGDGATATGRVVKHAYAQTGKFKVTITVWDATRLGARKYTFSKELIINKH